MVPPEPAPASAEAAEPLLAPTAVQLLDAAERLFAERGLDRVSLREIGAACGQRNSSVVHYHFGTREVMLRAVLERRLRPIDALRHRWLDNFEAGPEVRNAAALVRVSAGVLAEVVRGESWGPDYVRMAAQTASTPGQELDQLVNPELRSSIWRTHQLLRDRLPGLDDADFAHRLRLVSHTLTLAVARWIRWHGRVTPDNAVSYDSMVASTLAFVAAGMVAPAS